MGKETFQMTGTTDINQEVQEVLNHMCCNSDLAKELLAGKTIKIINTGSLSTGGSAVGTNVTVDIKKNNGTMSAKEAAETAIFELKNAQSSVAYQQHKTKLKMGTFTLKQYGCAMADTEFESTKAVGCRS